MSYSKEFIYADMELARKAVSEGKLDMTNIAGGLKYELYCIPSQDHCCFYAQILCSSNSSYMIYARTETDDLTCGKIFIRSFSDTVKNSKSNRSFGKTVCGMRKISRRLYDRLTQAFESLPDKTEWQTERGMVLDGVFQLIRMYENASVIKEFAYYDCDNYLLSDLYKAVEAEMIGAAIAAETVQCFFGR